MLRKIHVLIKKEYRRADGTWTYPVVLCGDYSPGIARKNLDNVKPDRKCKKCTYKLTIMENK